MKATTDISRRPITAKNFVDRKAGNCDCANDTTKMIEAELMARFVQPDPPKE